MPGTAAIEVLIRHEQDGMRQNMKHTAELSMQIETLTGLRLLRFILVIDPASYT